MIREQGAGGRGHAGGVVKLDSYTSRTHGCVGLPSHKVLNKALPDLTSFRGESANAYLVCLPTSCMLSRALIPAGVSMIHCAQIIARALAFMRFSSWCWDILQKQCHLINSPYSILHISSLSCNFKIICRSTKIKVVYHLHDETGSSTVCAHGKQKFLMVSSLWIGHSLFSWRTPIYQESLGWVWPDHDPKMAAGTSEELQMLSAFSIQDISVANFGQPYKSFRLFRRGSGSSRENCLSILILTDVSEFWDKW